MWLEASPLSSYMSDTLFSFFSFWRQCKYVRLCKKNRARSKVLWLIFIPNNISPLSLGPNNRLPSHRYQNRFISYLSKYRQPELLRTDLRCLHIFLTLPMNQSFFDVSNSSICIISRPGFFCLNQFVEHLFWLKNLIINCIIIVTKIRWKMSELIKRYDLLCRHEEMRWKNGCMFKVFFDVSNSGMCITSWPGRFVSSDLLFIFFWCKNFLIT